MLAVRLMDAKELTPDMRQDAIGRFLNVLQAQFNGLEYAFQAKAKYQRLVAKYKPHPVEKSAAPDERAVITRWEAAERTAHKRAFSPWPELDRGAYFEIDLGPDEPAPERR